MNEWMCSIYYKKYSGFVISRVSYKSITECCLISKLLLRPFYPSRRTGQHSIFYRIDYPLGEIYLRQILSKIKINFCQYNSFYE